MIEAVYAPGCPAHEAATQMIVSPCTSTSPTNATVGVTIVPRNSRALPAPGTTPGPAPGQGSSNPSAKIISDNSADAGGHINPKDSAANAAARGRDRTQSS